MVEAGDDGVTTPRIKFGTDGWRAVIGDQFTFANVRCCAQGVATYLRKTGLAERGLVVGYDTRFASAEFARTVVEVMAGNGIDVFLCDRPAPTPVVGYSIVHYGAGGGAIITASHNPFIYSGFKFRPDYAGSAPPQVLAEIEVAIPDDDGVETVPFDLAKAKGLVEMFDPGPAYREHISDLVDMEALRSAGLGVVVDSMHGAAAGYLRSLLAGGKTRVREIRSARNPSFPGMDSPEPIARNLRPLAASVRRRGADVGLATDGDGDRLGVIDEGGNFVDQLQTFGLLAYYLLAERGQRGAMVKSVTTTDMISRLGELYGVPVHQTAVGFKHLGPKMVETDAIIAGEESGGFAFQGHIPERDGLLSGLFFLDLMVGRSMHPSTLVEELYSKVGHHHYGRVDIPLAVEERPRIASRLLRLQPERIAGLSVVSVDRCDGVRYSLDGGWALIRISGTEPLLRIYAEVREGGLLPQVLEECRALLAV